MFNDFRSVYEIVQVAVSGAVVDVEAPERGSTGEKAHGDGGWFGGVSGMEERREEDFVDCTEGGEEVFFLFFHVFDHVFEVFASEERTTGHLTHDDVCRDGQSLINFQFWERGTNLKMEIG